MIKTPDQVKKMSVTELEDLAEKIREHIIEVTAANGGHLSSNLGAIELTLALVKVFDPLVDDLLFDVGHQSYTYKIITERDITNIRQNDGLAPFQDRRESAYDKYEGGHSSTSISVALGMSKAKKMSGDKSFTIAIIGDAALLNGLSLEGLNALASLDLENLIIVLNDNGMSIGPTKGGLSEGSEIDENFFKALDIDYLGPLDGHDISTLIDVFSKGKEHHKPLVIHLKTKKGHGYEPAMEDDSGYWHGVTPFDLKSLEPKDMHKGLISFSHAKSDILKEIMAKDEKTILINPAMVKGAGEDELFALYPSRTIDCGIAEEHAFTFASGLALKGYHPIISIYSTFFQRAFDECFHDLSHQRLDALVLLERSGLVGQDGETHQGIYDLNLLYTIPGAHIYEPYDYDSLTKVLELGSAFESLTFVRLPRELLVPNRELELTKDYELFANNASKVILAFGSEGKKLAHTTTDYDVVLTYKRNGFSKEFYDTLLSYNEVIVYDSTATYNSFGAQLALKLSSLGYRGTYKVHALPSEFIRHAKREEQLKRYKLDHESFLTTLKSKKNL